MQSGRARALLLSAVALFGALAFGAAFFLRDEARSSGAAPHARAAPDRFDSNAPAPVESAAERAPAKKENEHVADDGAEAVGDSDAEFRGTGSVTLTVVDAASDGPLADLPYLCWSERPSVHVYARGVTDPKGQAELANLPEDVVIFETARRPPYANTVFATWLASGRHREVTMRVGRGGKVVGRAVDDLGRPLEGVEVRFDPRPAQEALAFSKSLIEESSVIAERFKRSRDLIAKSGPDGRFEADALLSRYSAIWITHGAPDPRNELPIAVQLKWRRWCRDLSVKVHDGGTNDLGDVTIPRSRIFAGHVIDKDGTPVAGALVTALAGRGAAFSRRPSGPLDEKRRREMRSIDWGEEIDASSWPGERDFKLADEEALTTNDGAFEIDVSSFFSLTVVTLDGRVQFFPLPESAPGTRTDGVELRLKEQTLVALTLTQEGGRPFQPGRRFDWIQVTAVAADVAELGAESQGGGLGRYQARWYELPGDRIVALVVDVAGYQRWRAPWRPPSNGRDAVTIDLTPVSRRSIKLHLELHDPKEKASLKGKWISVVACLLGPERALASKERACCGLDVQSSIDLHAKSEVDLEVVNGREWHVYVHGPFVADSLQFEWIHAGSFVPGDERHEVELPPVSANWVAEQARLEKEWQQQQEERLRSKDSTSKLATVRVAAIDARSGAAIARPHLLVRSSEEPNSWSGFSCAGPGAGIAVPSGRHVAKVGAESYRDSAEIEYTVEPGATADLGTIALEPLPVYALQLVDRDGAPAAGQYSVLVYFDESNPRFWGGSDARGVALEGSRFELRAELPDRFLLTVAPDTGGSGLATTRSTWSQRFELERWSPDESRKIVLQRWHATTLVVDLSAIPGDLRGAAFRFDVAREPSAADRSSGGLAESRDAGPNEHRYRLLLPSGRYVCRGGCGLFSIPDTPLELTDEQDDVGLTIAAR